MPKYRITRPAPEDGGGQSKLQERVIESDVAPLFGVKVEDATPLSDWADASAAPINPNNPTPPEGSSLQSTPEEEN